MTQADSISTTSDAPQRAGYRPGLDYLRILSSIGIVWFHSPSAPGKSLALAGLAVFILLTFCLPVLTHAENRSFSLYLRQRAARLVLPWLFWSGVYGLIQIKLTHPSFSEILACCTLGALLRGPAIHLWYLPFAFTGLIMTYALLRLLPRCFEKRWLQIVVLLLGTTLLMVGSGIVAQPGAPWTQWCYALPLVTGGLAIGLCSRLSSRFAEQYATFLVGGILVGLYLGLGGYLRQTAGNHDWISCVPAVGLVCLGLHLCVKLPHIVHQLAAYSYGIYLLHPLWFLVIHKWVTYPQWWQFVVAGVIGATLSSMILSRFRWIAWLAFGQPLARTAPKGLQA